VANQSVSVKHSDPDWAKKIAARLEALTGKTVVAGFPKGSDKASQTYDNGASVLDVAVWNNFGATINHPGGTPYKREMTNNGAAWFGNAEHKVRFVKKSAKGADRLPVTKAHTINIPARPFMDNAVTRLQEDNAGDGAYIAKQVVDGELPPEKALEQIGLLAVKAIQEAITDDAYEPNKPSTIAKKGSDKPLQGGTANGGHLRQSVTYDFRDAGE
jgi:hypothetical protein